MKKLSIIILSGLLIFNCGNSPEKLLDKGDKYIANSEVEKAITSYKKLIDEFPNDSLAQTAQYNIAWILLDSKNDYYNIGYDKTISFVNSFNAIIELNNHHLESCANLVNRNIKANVATEDDYVLLAMITTFMLD